MIVYSPFEGHVESGVLGGLSVEAQVRPYVNRATLEASQHLAQVVLPRSGEGVSMTESSRGVATIVTAVFALLCVLLGGVVAFYWTAVLQPRLKTGSGLSGRDPGALARRTSSRPVAPLRR